MQQVQDAAEARHAVVVAARLRAVAAAARLRAVAAAAHLRAVAVGAQEGDPCSTVETPQDVVAATTVRPTTTADDGLPLLLDVGRGRHHRHEAAVETAQEVAAVVIRMIDHVDGRRCVEGRLLQCEMVAAAAAAGDRRCK